MNCPICSKPADHSRYRPFCSERCSLIDLDNWMSGRYAIPAVEQDAGEDVPGPSPIPPEQHDA